jgi:nucleolar pre-ribosomal-associated protein 1
VNRYWSAVALTLEPRLSTKWITNIAFFANVISLPIPATTFYLSNQLYNPTPPPLSAILENILPSVNIKKNLSKGLQSSCGLVQHCTALALSKCLVKFQLVMKKIRQIALVLEEEDDGQWSRRCMEVEAEVRKRVPDFMVVVAFGQQTQQGPTKTSPTQINNQSKKALLAESAQRLLWLYQHCLPAVVSEARFDVGKLLQTFASNPKESEHDTDTARRLHRVQQLHVLSILRDSDQFSWTTKSGRFSMVDTPPITDYHLF